MDFAASLSKETFSTNVAVLIQEKKNVLLRNIHTAYSTAEESDNYIHEDRIICSSMNLNGIGADYAENKGGSKMHYVQITVNPIICLS